MREKLGLSASTRMVLLSFGSDALLEKLDPCREQRLGKIAQLGFDLVTAVGYSVYDDDWPPETLNNQMRSLVSYQLLQEASAVSIPFVAWADDGDIRHWTEWLHSNRCVSMICFDLQSCADRDWQEYVDSLQRFLHGAPSHLEYVVNGVAAADRIDSLKRLLGPFHLTNEYAYYMAFNGQEDNLRPGGDSRAKSSASPVDIFLNYVRYFIDIMSAKDSSSVQFVPCGDRELPDLPLLHLSR